MFNFSIGVLEFSKYKSFTSFVVVAVHLPSHVQLCNLTNCNTPGLPVPHYLLEFAQVHVHSLVMPSSHLILWCPLLLLPSTFPSIRDFSNESSVHIRWPKYWNFSFSISPSSKYSGLVSFKIDWFDLLAVQGTFKSLFQHNSSKASMLQWFLHGYFMNLLWQRGLHNTMKLWAMPCSATQDRWVMAENSDKTWSFNRGNGKPLQYTCCENIMNCIKGQKDESKRWVKRLTKSWVPQVWKCPVCYCGKPQENCQQFQNEWSAWTKADTMLSWENLIQLAIISTTVGKNPKKKWSNPHNQQKSPKYSTWVQPLKMTEWSQFISKASHSTLQ